MPVPFQFDFCKPDYSKVFAHRAKMLYELNDPSVVAALKVYYKEHPAQFINDWGMTYDPRNPDIGLPANIPFVLFDRQEEWIDWVLRKWQNRSSGLTDKSREMGVSWLAISLSCTLCLFNNGISIGFGSRKLNLVDHIGNPDSLFWKARYFLQYVPQQFLGGFNLRRDAPFCRIMFDENSSSITGEGGDGIGRGGRKTIYFVDEEAYIERPETIEMSLSNTTNCRISISSARGMGNPFAQKRFSGKIDVFTFHWRSDPRKSDAHKAYRLRDDDPESALVCWYEKKVNELDPVTLAQEVDINYTASVEGVVIPSEWIQAAVNACAKLKIEPTGDKITGLDVADEGRDLNAICMRHGVEIVGLRSWSGKDSDTFYTCQKAFMFIDELGGNSFMYDADGLGAFVRGDSRVINEQRKASQQSYIDVQPFRGSGEVIEPEKEMIKGRKNKDYFANRKAQAWWMLRFRFQNTFRAVKGEDYDKENLISIPSNLPHFTNLIMELSQPTYEINATGKILIDKAPDGTRSPNYADAVMIAYSPPKRHKGLFS